ncbi:MAG: hypothetical protein H6Q14_2155 [Bacteroidetes bacterium]|nr:hypothetical protein [Bacteroidota bacterium]
MNDRITESVGYPVTRSLVYCYILLTFLSGCLFFSCKEDNDVISTDSSLKLTFSTDTVSFDTVFTSIKTSTKRILIHNKNKNAVNIESIQLMGGSGSFFRMNVDGYSGDQTNVELRGQDSMYVFIELTVDPQNSDNPIFIEDSIRFVTNGNVQYLHLEAYGQDVYIWDKKTLANDTTILGERPLLIYDTLTIAEGAHVTIESGTKLFFHKGAGLYVKGQLSVVGSIDNPVVFRGDRTDRLFSNVLYDNGVTGQWSGITVDSLSFNNVFENVRIRNSFHGINFKQSLSDETKATLTNVIIHNVYENGVTATNCIINFFNCQITNAKEMCVQLIGGQYTFLHCTIANYFNAVNESRASGSKTLYISNIFNNAVLPLETCNFTNCIISGSSSSDVELYNTLDGNEQTPFNDLFTSCLIRVEGEDDENFVNIIWDKDPGFENLNTNGDYVFSFELDSASVAINAAASTYSVNLPLDLKGISRISDDGPDIGCYEWQKKSSN